MRLPSPYVQAILDQNDFTYLETLRIGPRFACLKVQRGDIIGFFKCALPLEEQQYFREADYYWTHHDSVPELEKRLLREAAVLSSMRELIGPHTEPYLIDQGSEPAVWTLRSFVADNAFAQEKSNYIFNHSFYQRVKPDQMVAYFFEIHQMSSELSETTRELLLDAEYLQSLRYHGASEVEAYARTIPMLEPHIPALQNLLAKIGESFDLSTFVISHGEPYAPHVVFSEHGHLGFIDWENAGFNDPIRDFTIIYQRLLSEPAWQTKFYEAIKAKGYFEGTGMVRWDIEEIIQSLHNHRFLAMGNSYEDKAYDARALQWYEDEIERILVRYEKSPS